VRSRRFATFAWVVLAYNVLVILWGAFVRATGSGAGCGSHWPLCNGVAVPRAPQLETIIEFSHRLTSGLSAVLVAVLVIWGFRVFGRGQPVRKALVFSGILIITEALIGAGLVLFGWVADNQSVARAVSMALHLINTFFLLAALAFTAWWASGGARVRLRGRGVLAAAWLLGLVAVIFLGMSGAVTALGDTLFPAGSLAEGVRADFEPTAHFLVRMRVWHPVIAVVAAAYIVTLARTLASRRPSPLTTRLANLHVGLFVVQLAAGAINIVLLAPVWMQLVHLALACAVWLSLVLLGAAAFAVPVTSMAPARVEPASGHVAAH
jgi:heme A synthase